jgi:hypothetical protein
MDAQTLLQSPWFHVTRRGSVLEVARTDRGFETLGELDRAHFELFQVLDALPRARCSIVVDLRLAPPRNDPDFEQAMLRHRPRLFEGFARRAVVVRSAVGRLNVQRHAKTDGHDDLAVFTDLDAAFQHAAA